MKYRILSLVLVAVMALSLCGCGDTVGNIAGSVMDAAGKELQNQVTQLLENNKLEVVEVKTAFGQLNDEGSKYQFFVAALVRSNGTAVPQSTADTLAKLFTDGGLSVQSQPDFRNDYLIHKSITFKHSDFSEENYYVIWGYAADLTAKLPDLSQLSETLGK